MKQILVSLLVLGLALSFGACASSGSGVVGYDFFAADDSVADKDK